MPSGYFQLQSQLPEDQNDFTKEDQAKWLLANMVDYFWREEKTKFWEFYRLLDLEDDEIIEEKSGIAFLTHQGRNVYGKDRNPTDRYSFPEQEMGIKLKADLFEPRGDKIGTLHTIDRKSRTIEIKKTGKSKDIHPSSVVERDIFVSKDVKESLRHYIDYVAENGLNKDESHSCLTDLLLRTQPQLKTDQSEGLRRPNESALDVGLRIVKNLDNSYLPIQGPPGSGKTHTGGLLILELLKQGKKVGLTANSHKVIQNLLNKVIEHASGGGKEIEAFHFNRGASQESEGNIQYLQKMDDVLDKIDQGKLIGGTAHFWAKEPLREQLDYLFIDEAGQLALSLVIAAGCSAQNLILLGDPRQLEQPQQGSHPENSGISGLDYILGEDLTLPKDKGLFLDTTWRLPPSISRFTSEVYYENRLSSKDGLETQVLNGSRFEGNGLYYHPVNHLGNQNHSKEEVDAVQKIVEEIISESISWTNRKRDNEPITGADFRIVAPYNIQVNAIKEVLPDVQVGTVDKFQGQEAPIVIYSMTTSSPEDAPRGMGFLYSPNRFNVATSRAQCISILVCSPLLLEPECHSIEQMRWANGLCRYSELADHITDFLDLSKDAGRSKSD